MIANRSKKGHRGLLFQVQPLESRQLLALLTPSYRPTIEGTNPSPLGALDEGHVLFQADGADVGREIWISDGTVPGTHRLKDVTAGAGGSTLKYLDAGNRFALFAASADSSSVAHDVWVARTTAKSTKLLLPASTSRQYITDEAGTFNGRVLFNRADSKKRTTDLWISDGTPVGTIQLTSGIADADGVEQFTTVGDQFYFVATTAASDQLWVSDGTAAGTHQVDLGQIYITGISELGGRLYVGVAPVYGRTPGLYELRKGALRMLYPATLTGSGYQWSSSMPFFSVDQAGAMSLVRWDGKSLTRIDVGAIEYASANSFGENDIVGGDANYDMIFFSTSDGRSLYRNSPGDKELTTLWQDEDATGPIKDINGTGDLAAFVSGDSLLTVFGKRAKKAQRVLPIDVRHVIGVIGERVLIAYGNETVNGLYSIHATGGAAVHLTPHDAQVNMTAPTKLLAVGDQVIGQVSSDISTNLTHYSPDGRVSDLGRVEDRDILNDTAVDAATGVAYVLAPTVTDQFGNTEDHLNRVDLSTDTITTLPLHVQRTDLLAADEGELVFTSLESVDSTRQALQLWTGATAITVGSFDSIQMQAVHTQDVWLVTDSGRLVWFNSSGIGHDVALPWSNLAPMVGDQVMGVAQVNGRLLVQLQMTDRNSGLFKSSLYEFNPTTQALTLLANIGTSDTLQNSELTVDGTVLWFDAPARVRNGSGNFCRYAFDVASNRLTQFRPDSVAASFGIAGYWGGLAVAPYYNGTTQTLALLNQDGSVARTILNSAESVARLLASGKHLYIQLSTGELYRYSDVRLELLGTLTPNAPIVVAGDMLFAAGAASLEKPSLPVVYRYRPQVSIAGSVFLDGNGNGSPDTGERPLKGWRVFIDKDNDGVLDKNEYIIRASSTGRFEFYDLGAATYTVRVMGYDGYIATTPLQYTVKTSSTSTATKRFGFKTSA
ncbi:MAG: hypothetical protein QM770_21995 [Tepidisphaeraceae bacterium]